MKVELECTYCGHKWTETVYNQHSLSGKKCSKCQDKNLKFRDLSSKINYYEGSPEFPKTEKDDYGVWRGIQPDLWESMD